MPRVGFEPQILGFQRANILRASDRAATAAGYQTNLVMGIHILKCLDWPQTLHFQINLQRTCNSVTTVGKKLQNKTC
jgi:hypothetical protein